MARKAKNPFDTVTSNLGQLSRVELEELVDIVAAMLAATEAEEEDDDQVVDQGDGEKVNRPAARGHIEAKMINGFGPYLYLRYWSGKTLKSKYIGKAKQS